VWKKVPIALESETFEQSDLVSQARIARAPLDAESLFLLQDDRGSYRAKKDRLRLGLTKQERAA